MGNGIVHEAVDILLLARQAHHAEAQQGDGLAATVLHAVGHLGIGVGSREGTGSLGKSTQGAHGHQGRAEAEAAQELAPADFLNFFL